MESFCLFYLQAMMMGDKTEEPKITIAASTAFCSKFNPPTQSGSKKEKSGCQKRKEKAESAKKKEKLLPKQTKLDVFSVKSTSIPINLDVTADSREQSNVLVSTLPPS